MFDSTAIRDSSESVSPSNQEQVTDDHATETSKPQDLATNLEDITDLPEEAIAPIENENEITSPSNKLPSISGKMDLGFEEKGFKNWKK